MQIRFVVLPPKNISEMASKLAKKYAAKFPHWFVVDNRKLFPHITLFCLEIKRRDLNTLTKVAGERLPKQKKLKLLIPRHAVYKDSWEGLKIKNNVGLSALRKNWFKGLVSFDKYPQRKLKLSFSPHITLTKFKNKGHSRLAIKGSKILIKKFRADTIAMCLNNRFSQVTKIIKKFKLK